MREDGDLESDDIYCLFCLAVIMYVNMITAERCLRLLNVCCYYAQCACDLSASSQLNYRFHVHSTVLLI